MHLVALISHDTPLGQALSGFRDEAQRVYLHPVSPSRDIDKVLAALEPLDFAGALVLEPSLQTRAFELAQRSSLDAQQVQSADALTVTPGGLIAEHNFGRAIGAALRGVDWDARGASVVVLGAGMRARAVSRELSSLGVRKLAVLAANRPSAEQTAANLAASTEITATAKSDPLAKSLIENADLLLRVDPAMSVDTKLLGPHLTFVDLSPQAMSPLRAHAMSLGALTLSLRDVQAQQLALSLNHILGARFAAESFLDVLHALE